MFLFYYIKVFLISCSLLLGLNGSDSSEREEILNKINNLFLINQTHAVDDTDESDNDDADKEDTTEESDVAQDNDEIKNGWVKNDGKTYYYVDGILQTGNVNIYGSYANYYFDEDGVLYGVDFDIKNLINQRTLNKYSCSGASALMASQSIGYYTDTSLREFWTDIEESLVPGEGFFAGGLLNPYLTEWLSETKGLPASRVPYVTADVIREYLTDGQTVIACITKDEGTHWVYVYGWYERDGETIYKIADSWGTYADSDEGVIYEKTYDELEYELTTASKWNSAGMDINYPTDAVVIGYGI